MTGAEGRGCERAGGWDVGSMAGELREDESVNSLVRCCCSLFSSLFLQRLQLVFSFCTRRLLCCDCFYCYIYRYFYFCCCYYSYCYACIYSYIYNYFYLHCCSVILHLLLSRGLLLLLWNLMQLLLQLLPACLSTICGSRSSSTSLTALPSRCEEGGGE